MMIPDIARLFTDTAERMRAARPLMAGFISGHMLLAGLENWRQQNASNPAFQHLPAFYDADRMIAARDRTNAWNEAESAVSKTELGEYTIRSANPQKTDLDIAKPAPLLGAAPVIAIGGAVVIGSFVAYVTRLITANQQDARDLSRELTRANAKIASSPPEVRRSFEALQRSAPFEDARSTLEKALAGASTFAAGGGIGIALALGAVLFLSSRGQPREAVRNPGDGKCDKARGGYGTPPWEWRMKWPTDPAKLIRKIDALQNDLRPKTWKNWESVLLGWRADAERMLEDPSLMKVSSSWGDEDIPWGEEY